ncbi:MAG: UDP-glucose--hexose-1-phosphate uridylyltransferase [Flammeovirgaceae bacterium]|nr:UDP-glucose--hexose-1-phosphate uridylyltransferase [Flammeovirgaceae bacterium]
MASFIEESSHYRKNILTGEWILVSPHRTKRPWQGKTEAPDLSERPAYDPNCYLCSGNTRANGETNPDYKDIFVFTNDFAALTSDSSQDEYEEGLLYAVGETGICRVICFSPNHSLTLAQMDDDSIKKVVDTWQFQYKDLGSHSRVDHVQIFENKGDVMGCSNPHPHGQVWAQSSVPVEVQKKSFNQKKYFDKHKKSLLKTYLEEELKHGKRIVLENEDFVVVVPFWAVWPYETMIIPRRHVTNITELTESEKLNFARAIQGITIAYDNLFECSFPYSSGIHQAPTDKNNYDFWHMHMSFYPPLLRSATVKKFMVGYEMFANPQRDITAEQAAEKLRALPATHYKNRNAEW